MLNVQDLSFSFGHRKVLKDINFTISNGEIVGLVAPNGTGKSTLLRCIMDLLRPTTGNVQLSGFDHNRQHNDFLRNVFFAENNEMLYPELTAAEHLQYVIDIWHSPVQAQTVLKSLKMQDYSSIRVRNMSLGMKQHVLLGMAFSSGAPLLIFDEPLNGLDPSSTALFTQIILGLRAKGRSVIMSSHQLTNVSATADRVFFLKEGKITVYPNDNNVSQQYASMFPEEASVDVANL